MTQCRFCKSDIPSDASRCPHCTSFLNGEQPQGLPGQVTYIVDKGLVTFAKFASAVLAVFLTVGVFVYGLDIKQIGKEVEQVNKEIVQESKEIKETFQESQKLGQNMKQAKSDLEKEAAEIKKGVETAEGAANVASDTSSRAQSLLREAEESAGRIHRFEITLLSPSQGPKLAASPQASQSGPDPAQVDRAVDSRLLETLANILSPKQYSALKTKIAAKQSMGLRRQIFDAKNSVHLPGDLVRSEGDAPISDSAANEVYYNLEIIYRFFKDVFGWKIPDNKDKILVTTIHYGKDYDNSGWTGRQLYMGDGDGILFRKGGFSSLSAMAHDIGSAVNNYTAQLEYEGQSGALSVSFANIMSCLVEQWQKKQTTDEANWLVGADMFAPGFTGRALYDLANPGTAYDDPNLGKDPQPGHMKDYVQTDSDNGGVHTNSGIPSRAFVLTAKAIGGNSWEKAGKIWYITLTKRLNGTPDFAKFAAETVTVARDLFPEDPSIVEKVAKAWADVGVLEEGSTTNGASRVKR
jgi:Zn-dependent metalloprotease